MILSILKENNKPNYDIPEEYLLQRIAQAKDDIANGRFTTHEKMKKRFHK